MPEPASHPWHQTWTHLATPPPHLLEDLQARYAEPHRSYHTLEHILDCLDKAAACRELQTDPGAVDLALWFHDAVYEPRRSDNEVASARLVREALSGVVSAERLDRIEGLILATRHLADGGAGGGSAAASQDDPDRAVVMDVDLSILGEAPAVFERYQAGIRAEYSWVPVEEYRRRRREVLESFLARPRIFETDLFFERYEARARENLARAISELSLDP